jgi:ankyrin repeat protein
MIAQGLELRRSQIVDWRKRIGCHDNDYRSCRLGKLPAAEALVECGAKITSEDPREPTSLVKALEHGHHEVARLLIAQGADVNNEERRAGGRHES